MLTALQSSRTTSEAVRALADKPFVQRSFPLVQQVDLNFLYRTNCSSDRGGVTRYPSFHLHLPPRQVSVGDYEPRPLAR